ncbi:retrovirus-related pol polyprotein from transposon TNT 1-94 [Tanacetum coccineum]
MVKGKGKRRSLALKGKKESSDEESLTFRSKDEEYAMAVRDFKKFFKRRGRCEDPNHLIEECPKPPRDKNQRAFVGGSWSDGGEEDDEKAKDKTYLMAKASSEIFLGIDLEPDKWIKDSRCTKHMTANQKLFSTYKAYNGGNVIFGSNLRGNIIGKGVRYLELLHMDHFDPSAVRSYGGNLYTLVIVEDRKKKGCTYKNFSAFNPSEFNGEGDAIITIKWIMEMESVINTSNCADDEKVKLQGLKLIRRQWMQVLKWKRRNLGRMFSQAVLKGSGKEVVEARRGLTLVGSTECYKCGKQGHISKEYQNSRSCYECGERGHIRPDCPKLKKGTSGNFNIIDGRTDKGGEMPKAKG